MRKPGGGCPDILKGLTGEMFDIGLRYKKDKVMSKQFGYEIDNVIKKVYEDVFDVPFDARHAVNYTKGRLRTFENRLWRIKDAIKNDKLSSKFGSLFYAPSSLIKSNPQLGVLMDKLHNVNLEYQGRNSMHDRQFENILTFMKKEMVVNNYNNSEMFPNMSTNRRLRKAIKLANKFDRQVEELSVKAAQSNSQVDKNNLTAALDLEHVFYTRGEGKVFNDMVKTIEKTLPELETKALDKWRLKYKELEKKRISRPQFEAEKKKALNIVLSDKIKSEPMRNAVAEYVILMDNMYDTLTKGISAYGKSLKASMKDKYDDAVVDKIVDGIIKKVTPDKQRGYFPHYRRVLSKDFLQDLMPHMQRVSDTLAKEFEGNKTAVDDAMDQLKGFVTGRAKSREKLDLGEGVDVTKEYSRNFFTTVKRYVDEIDRFNMMAHADQYTRESLVAAKELFKSGKPMDNYARATVEMMKDMNSRMKGSYGMENETAELMMKSLLALEFTSKLGFNLRSPFKNATQGLLNVVQFSPQVLLNNKKFYEQRTDVSGRKLSLYVDELMEEAGFLFAENAPPELIEARFKGGSFTSKIKITDNETAEFKKPSWFSPIHEKITTLSGKSGVLMGKVENFNRKTTFKLAFGELYDKLDNSTHFKQRLRDTKKWSELQIDNHIKHLSKNYALRKTSLLHFDYTDLGKASWITHPAGRLLGQFQHYGIKFFEHNIDLARNAKDDIMAGEVLGDRARKAYSMAMVYGMAPVIASAITGVDFSSVVEHDMAEKFKKLAVLFTGDDEDIKKAYYGKGVATGLPFIGAPVVSDALAVGNILNFIDMDNETMEKMLIGYEDYSLKSDDRKVYELMRTLNVQLGRFAYRTLPMLREGKFGSALQYEAGLYPTAESRELKKKSQEVAKDILPPDLLEALQYLEAHREKATSKR